MTQVTLTNRTQRTIEVTNKEVIKMELNEAIFYIITHNIPKKDMKERVRLVKKAGYEVYKGGRKNWVVNNPVTQKYVSADVRWREVTLYNNGRFSYSINTEGCQSTTEYWDRCHVDFVGILTKPVNKDWLWELNYKNSFGYWWYRTPTQQKFDRLKSAKSSVRYRAKDIKETQKQIEELQRKLIRLAGDKVNAENNLNDVRKQLGLRTR